MLLWAAVLGAVGLVCGFIGPIVLAPDANQGPLLGIFITGPAGAVLGAVLGGVARLLSLSKATATRSLHTMAVVVAVTTLYFCIPSPSYRADIVDGEIRQCIAPESLKKITVDRLNEVTAARTPLRNPVQWSVAFDKALAANAGVVIEVHVIRQTKLYENRARWNLGTPVVKPWIAGDADKRYFASYLGKDCAGYATGARILFAATGHVSIWPPAYTAEMLDLKVAGPLPASVAGLLH